MNKPLHRLLSGFIRMHILHHTEEGDICGHWMMGELRHHGYDISPGTLYPMLRSLERDGWIKSRKEKSPGLRTLYRITPTGRTALREARARLRELFREVGTPS